MTKMKKLIIVLTLIFARTASAQEFSAELLAFESAGFLSATSISSNGNFLLFSETDYQSGEKCDFEYDRSTKNKVSLCSLGFSDAYKVNNNGTVLGNIIQDNIFYAAVWNPSMGVKIINDPKNNSTSTKPIDLDDHDRAYAVANRVVEYELAGSLSEKHASFLSPRSLVWMQDRGVRLLFPKEKYANAILQATNSGKLLYIRASKPDRDPSTLKYRPYFAMKMKAYLKLPHKQSQLLKSEPIYYEDFSISEFASSAAIADQTRDVVIEGQRHINNRVPKIVASRYLGERSDSPYEFKMDNAGRLMGRRGYHWFIDAANRGAVELQCLIPFNRQIINAGDATNADMDIYSLGGITSVGEIFVGADIANDGAYSKLLIISPSQKLGSLTKITDYCPEFNYTTEVNGDESEFQISLNSGSQTSAGLNFELFAIDADESCPELSLGKFKSDLNGIAKVKVLTNYKFNFEIRYASPDDARYRFYSSAQGDGKSESIFQSADKDYQCNSYSG